MSKAVLMSIHPKFCYFIANGKKTLEVRKTIPKIHTPFKCYIYCTNASKKHQTICGCMVLNSDELYRHPKDGIKYGDSIELMCCDDYSKDNFLNGKVIGEFVCDEIGTYYAIYPHNAESHYCNLLEIYGCVTAKEVQDYGKDKPLYGMHISDLVIYDEPKELSEFRTICRYRNNDGSCQYDKVECDCCKFDFNPDYSINFAECLDYMSRPPQSWCYVEEIL